MIRNDMRRPTNEHEIFQGRMKQGNSRTEFEKNCQERYAGAIRSDIYESMNLRPENVNDDSTNDYLDKLVKEQMEAESNENRQMARLQSYFLWSEQKIIELQAEIKSFQEEVSQHIKRNKDLSAQCSQLQELLDEQKWRTECLEERLEQREDELSELNKENERFRKVIWKNIHNGKWNNKKTRKLVKKRDICF